MDAEALTWREVLLDALQAQGVDRLTELCMQRVSQDTDVLADDPDLLALTRRSTSANLALVVEVTAGNVALEDAVPTGHAAALARELARRNIPMAELARIYRIVQHEVWRFGVARIRETIRDEAEAREAVERYTDAAFVTGETLASAVLERYARERQQWARGAEAMRLETFRALMAEQHADVASASRRLSYELRRDHVAYVVWGEPSDPLEQVAVEVGAGSALVIPIGSQAFAGWCAPGAVEAGAADGARVALGTAGHGMEGFRRSHREALEARRVAELADRPSPVRYEEVALLALLTRDEAQARRFMARVLGPLAAGDDTAQRLLETVRAVLEEQLSPRRAATRLGVHENTVAKRIRAAEDLLGHAITDRPAELLAALEIARLGR